MEKLKSLNGFLLYACQVGDLKLVKDCISRGANIKNVDLLINSSGLGYFQIVKYLISHGVDVNGESFSTPLYAASTNGHLKIVKYLIYHGADVNKGKMLPLYTAIYNNH